MAEPNTIRQVPEDAPDQVTEDRRAQLLDEVRVDARRDPERWLEDAEVPEGGE